MIEYVESSLREAERGLAQLLSNSDTQQRIVKASELIADCFQADGRVFSCGNGGSLCDAIHFAEELSGRYRKDRRALGAIAISDSAHITCTGNDYGFSDIYSRFLEGNARSGDVLLAITTSGKSPNIIKAARTAKEIGVKVIGLTGNYGSEFEPLSDIAIVTPAGDYADRVQELHIKVIHILIELVERKLFNVSY